MGILVQNLSNGRNWGVPSSENKYINKIKWCKLQVVKENILIFIHVNKKKQWRSTSLGLILSLSQHLHHPCFSGTVLMSRQWLSMLLYRSCERMFAPMFVCWQQVYVWSERHCEAQTLRETAGGHLLPPAWRGIIETEWQVAQKHTARRKGWIQREF